MRRTRSCVCVQTILTKYRYPVDRDFEYLPTVNEGLGGGADKYLDFLTTELRPFISSNFRAIESGPVGIAGSSWGGVISFYAWLTRPNEFSLCGMCPLIQFHAYHPHPPLYPSCSIPAPIPCIIPRPHAHPRTSFHSWHLIQLIN